MSCVIDEQAKEGEPPLDDNHMVKLLDLEENLHVIVTAKKRCFNDDYISEQMRGASYHIKLLK